MQPESPAKKVDEAWKNAVENEKQALSSQGIPKSAGLEPKPDPQFLQFLQTLGMQAVMMLEESEMEQAKFLIDTIRTLKKKTQGNLAQEEEALLQNLVYELELKYVERSKAPK